MSLLICCGRKQKKEKLLTGWYIPDSFLLGVGVELEKERERNGEGEVCKFSWIPPC